MITRWIAKSLFIFLTSPEQICMFLQAHKNGYILSQAAMTVKNGLV